MVKKNPKVSIIIPVYNVEKYLRECLDSMINQTLKEIEIICINDGSTDGSGLILEEFKNKDERFILISQENKGLPISRNVGISLAKGEYITFVDSDDFIDTKLCEDAYNSMIQSGAEVGIYKINAFFDEKKNNEQQNQMKLDADIYYNSNFTRFEDVVDLKQFDLFFKYSISSPATACKFYKHNFLTKNEISFVDSKLIHEDEGWFLKWVANMPSLKFIDNNGYYRRVHDDSITGKINSNESEKKRSLIHKKLVFKDSFKYFKKLKLSNKYRICLLYRANVLLKNTNKIRFYNQILKFYRLGF